MAKTHQVMKLSTCGKRFTVVFHKDTKNNPFWLYEHSCDYDEHGYLKEHKKLVDRWQNFESVLHYLLTIEAFRKDVW